MPITYLDEQSQGKITYLEEIPKSGVQKVAQKATDYFFPQALTEKQFAPGERNVFGDILERPGAAIRGAIFPKEGESRIQGYQRGAVLPESQPSAAESLYLKSGIQPTGKISDIPKAFPSAFAGTAIDIGTQPANYLLGMFGAKAGKQVGQELGKAGKLVKSTAEKIADAPIGQTISRGFNNALESAKYPLKSGKSMVEAFGNVKKSPELAERTRKAFYKVKSDAVSKFGDQLDELAQTNLDKTVSLRDVVDDIILNIEDMPPEAKSVLRKVPKLGEMLDNPELANNINLKGTQEIINYLNNKVPAQIKFKHLDILDTLSDVRASQLDAFPEMANVRADYAKVIEPYKNLKNYFKFNKLLKGIENDFGGAEGMKAVKSILPEKVIKEMGGYKNAIMVLRNLKSGVKKGAIGALLGGAGYGGYRFTKGVLGE